MKRAVSLILTCLIACVCAACGDENVVLDYSFIQGGDYLHASVIRQNDRQRVLWFQVLDQVKDSATIDGYRNVLEKLGDYPVKVELDKWVWIMVNERIEIRVMADEKADDFRDTRKLLEFLGMFDLEGLKKIRGYVRNGKQLRKYIPKLDRGTAGRAQKKKKK
ncbi:MAG: hypothetical protein GY754_23680 [bacterium]|nr:hypothetical protein [bacterium]MCP4133992.1 hypothetical protein [bacterium]